VRRTQRKTDEEGFDVVGGGRRSPEGTRWSRWLEIGDSWRGDAEGFYGGEDVG
jgi:hypothetical protein